MNYKYVLVVYFLIYHYHIYIYNKSSSQSNCNEINGYFYVHKYHFKFGATNAMHALFQWKIALTEMA